MWARLQLRMLNSFAKGTRVWLVEKYGTSSYDPDAEEVFTPAIIEDGTITQDGKDDKIVVETEDGDTLSVPVSSLYERNPKILEGTDDLTHEPAVLHNLEQRYHLNQIYTFSSTILIALNPYQALPIYQDEFMRSYAGQPIEKLQPHVYSLAEQAYRTMLTERSNQSILVSGESGAGKTEFLLRYFAAMGTSSERSIEYKVVNSTPILEAFGNAQTLRNDNSSRFGKWLEVQFDNSGNIIGANLRTYLLEKSRLIKLGSGERNYHIFYQLCAGAEQDLKDKLHLTEAEDYFYLNQSDSVEIDGVSDEKVFEATKKALAVVGINQDEQEHIFSVLAAILHLGNITFESGKNDASVIEDVQPLNDAAEILGMSPNEIAKTMTQRKMNAGKETYWVPLHVADAEGARDSMAMLLYSRMFDWLVGRINKSINHVGNKMRNFIGVLGAQQSGTTFSANQPKLDIYGFETFQTNSFEQFCINYANEVLQQQFNQHIFKLEQIEYEKEKIDWTYIEFNDNQPCLDLIEKRMGILAILDEECRFPRANADSFTQKLYTNVGKHDYFFKPRFSNLEFGIKHYAGDVTYASDTFLEKNKDFIIPPQLVLIAKSKQKFVANLKAKPKAAARKKPSKRSRKGSTTFGLQSVASQFKTSLATLMETIHKTSPHYIRCIKPNEEKKPLLFAKNSVLRQLRCGGVIESIRICRAGFPTRRKYAFFLKRYALVVKNFRPVGAEKEKVEKLVAALGLDIERAVRFGLTKVFMKTGELAKLEQRRNQRITEAVLVLQKNWRCIRQRRIYLHTKKQILLVQSAWRRSISFEKVVFMRQKQASTMLQKVIRCYNARTHLLKCIRAVTVLQQFARGYAAHCVYIEYKRERAAIIISKYWRSWRQRTNYLALKKASIFAQNLWRRKVAVTRKTLRELKSEARKLSNVVQQKKKLEKEAQDLQSKFLAEAEEKRRIEQELQIFKARALRIEIEREAKIKEKRELKKRQSESYMKLETEFQALKDELEQVKLENDELAQQLDEANAKLEQRDTDSAITIEKLGAQIDKLKQTHKEEIDRMRLAHEQEIEELKNSHDERVEKMRVANEATLAKLQASLKQHANGRTAQAPRAASPPTGQTPPIAQAAPKRKKTVRVVSASAQSKPQQPLVKPRKSLPSPKAPPKKIPPVREAKVSTPSVDSAQSPTPTANGQTTPDVAHDPKDLYFWQKKYKLLNEKYNTLKTSKVKQSMMYSTVGATQGNGLKNGGGADTTAKNPNELIDKLSTLRRENEQLIRRLKHRDVRNVFSRQANGNNTPSATSSKHTDLIVVSGQTSSQTTQGITAKNDHNTEAHITKVLETQLGPGFASQKMLVDNAIRCQFGKVDTDMRTSKTEIEANGEFAFVREIPTPAFAIFRCLVFWKCLTTGDQSTVLQSSRVLSYIPKAISEGMKGCERDSVSMAYWMSTVACLLHLIRQSLAVERPGLARDELAESRIKKMIHTLGRLLLRIFSIMGNNLISNIKPHLSHIVSGNAQAAVNAIKLYIKRYLGHFQRCRVYNTIVRQFFAQMFSLMNQIIFNTILLQRDLCSFSVAIKTKMHLSLLNAELMAFDKGTKMIPKMEEHMKETYQLICLLTLANKSDIMNPDILCSFSAPGICPDLTLLQVKQVFSMYNLNCDEHERPVPVDVIASMVLAEDYKVDQPLLMQSIKFTFTAERLHRLQLVKVQKWKFEEDLVDNLTSTKGHSPNRPKSGFLRFGDEMQLRVQCRTKTMAIKNKNKNNT